MEEIEDYRVYSIKIDGAITIDYSFKKFNEYSGKAVKIKLYDKPHEDFYKALDGIKECFYQMIGFPMAEAETGQKLNVIVDKVTFVDSAKNGEGMKITASVYGIEQHDKPTVLTTLPFYHTGLREISAIEINGCRIARYTQQLSSAQIDAMNRMKKEAFLFAYYGKKLQPTLEEAAQLTLIGD